MNNGDKSDTSDPGVARDPRPMLRTVVRTGALALVVLGLLALLLWRHSPRTTANKSGDGGVRTAASANSWRHGAMAPPAAGTLAAGKVVVKGGWGSAPGQF